MSLRSILIVDDSLTLRKMVRAALSALPAVSFTEAASGLEALERLSLSRPDLIFLDVNMPDMHGLELLRFLRSHDSHRSIPVIMLTTRGDEALRAECLALGAARYMTKPFVPSDVAAAAEAVLAQAAL